MCPHRYHLNGFMATPALGTQEVRIYIYIYTSYNRNKQTNHMHPLLLHAHIHQHHNLSKVLTSKQYHFSYLLLRRRTLL